MTKKTLFIILLGFASIFPLQSQSSLLSAYQSGKIVLSPDPRFGRGVDWESLVLHFANDMTVAPDGSIFVANNRENAILKFDGDGRLVKKFGRKGQGPGDFEFPGDLCVLDGRALVVGEYAGNRRISLFDLKGNHLKLMRTNGPVFGIAALKKNIIAYRSWSFNRSDPTMIRDVDHYQIYVKDIVTGREVRVADAKIPYKSIGALRLDASVCGTILIAGTADVRSWSRPIRRRGNSWPNSNSTPARSRSRSTTASGTSASPARGYSACSPVKLTRTKSSSS